MAASPTAGLCWPLCVGRQWGAMGTGRAGKPGGLRRLQAQAPLMGDCQGFGGDRVSAASSCPKPLLLFSRGTQLPSLCRARAVGDPEEIGGSSQQGSRGLLSAPPHRTPVHDHLRFGDWFGKTSELLNTVPKVSGASGFQSALRRAHVFDLQQALAQAGWAQWPLRLQCIEGGASCVWWPVERVIQDFCLCKVSFLCHSTNQVMHSLVLQFASGSPILCCMRKHLCLICITCWAFEGL